MLGEDQCLQCDGIKRVEIGKSHALGHCAQYARTVFARKKNANEKEKNHKKICTTGNFCCSHRHLRCRAHRMTPVDPFQQHRELRYRQRNRSTLRLRPDESPALQPLREQTQPISIEPQHLDQITAPSTEQEHMTGKWVLL